MIDLEFYPLKNKPHRIAVGLMSGTSVDGVDAACVSIKGQGEAVSVELLAFLNIGFDPAVKKRIFDCFDGESANIEMLGPLNMELGEVYAKAALEVIKKAKLTPQDVDFVASHGQTVYHEPNGKDGRAPFTMQLGEGNVIAALTGIVCVSDFRNADIALCGQGAPLVPFSEYLLYKSSTDTVLLQNIGGIGNITVLPAGGDANSVFAFDTGPGNMISDALMSIITNGGQGYDKNGEMAASGTVNDDLLCEMLGHEYFTRALPKSTGREDFGVEYTQKLYARGRAMGLADQDIVASAQFFTAKTIADAYEKYILPKHKAKKLILGGGGGYNKTLVNMIKACFEKYKIDVITQEEIGFSCDAKEAIAFAILGDCTLRGIPSSMPAVTGAKRAAMLGKISLP